MRTSQNNTKGILFILIGMVVFSIQDALIKFIYEDTALYELYFCLLYTSPSPRDKRQSRMPSSA